MAAGKRMTMPSSLHNSSTSTSHRSPRRAWRASPHGACTRAPNGDRMHTRQSPISSRNRSTTMVRSSGNEPVASAWSSRYCTRLRAAQSSRPNSSRKRGTASAPRIVRTNSPTARPSSSGRPGTVAAPERHTTGLTRRRVHDHAIERDLVDLPRGGTEQERLARPALVHHLFVELADPHAVGQDHGEQAAIGDGAAAGDGEPLRAGSGADGVVARDPTRCAGEARRTLRTDSAPTTCRAPSEQRRRTARGNWRRAAPSPASSSTANLAPHTWRRSAGPTRRAGCGDSGWLRSRRAACDRRPPRPRRDRRDAWGTLCLGWAGRLDDPPARRVAGPRDTAPGDSTWITRSTAPMSMPNSSELVATNPRNWPVLSSSSMRSRRSRDKEP